MTARTGGTGQGSMGASGEFFSAGWNSPGGASASREGCASNFGGGVRCGRVDVPVWRSRTLERKRWLMSLRLRGFLGWSCILHPCRFHRAVLEKWAVPALLHLDNVVQLSELILFDVLVIRIGDPFAIDDQAVAVAARVEGQGHAEFAGALAGLHHVGVG